MSRRVYVHVGAPKTGTTYLQDRLALNADSLRRHGYRYPVGLHDDMFLAALDLLDRPWGGMRPQAEGEWDALVKRVRRARGTAIVSHEILAGAKPGEVRRAMGDLSEFAEVHVVYTARDVARQVAAEWQEQVKHQRKVSFATFLDQVRETDQSKATRWFWRVQGLGSVLDRWGAQVPRERFHVVTVPRPGAPAGELWRRFCTATGMDPSWAPLEGDRRNPSIGTAETTLLRRVNARLKEAGLPSDQYRSLIRHTVVHETLARREGMQSVSLPPELHGWAEEIAQLWIDRVTEAGVRVVGDLEELRPAPPEPDAPWQDPDKPRPRDVNAAAVDAIVALTLEAARRPDPDQALPTRAARLARYLRR